MRVVNRNASPAAASSSRLMTKLIVLVGLAAVFTLRLHSSEVATLLIDEEDDDSVTDSEKFPASDLKGKCTTTETFSVLQEEDLELSCAAFRSKQQHSLADVFGYLGKANLEKARALATEIKEKRHNLRVTLGAGPSTTKIENGILTDIPVVDILNATKMAALFEQGTVKTFIASHVWEHFTYPQAVTAFQTMRCLLDPNVGVLRFAVPDAYNVHDKYRDEKVLEGFPDRLFKAKVPYPGHRALWTEPKLAAVASIAGFDVRPLEWFSEFHEFCQVDYEIKTHGRIGRSIRYSKKDTEFPYISTSLIADLTPQLFQTPKVRST